MGVCVLPCAAVGWSVVRNCGISWYPLAFVYDMDVVRQFTRQAINIFIMYSCSADCVGYAPFSLT